MLIKQILNVHKLNFPLDKTKIREIKPPFEYQRAFRVQNCAEKGLIVLVTVAVESDGQSWLHVSFSRKKKLPDYQDTIFVKKNFFGKKGKAIMVFPPEDEHINDNPNCLHLWACLDADNLPDFRVNIAEGIKTI